MVEGTQVHFSVATAAAPLLLAFAKYFNDNIEPIAGGTYDDWGYAYRNVRGATKDLSNHASGTAIDINSTQHPLGARDTFTPQQEILIRAECKRLGMRWGGDFTRSDEMHFEIAIGCITANHLIKMLKLSMPKLKGK